MVIAILQKCQSLENDVNLAATVLFQCQAAELTILKACVKCIHPLVSKNTLCFNISSHYDLEVRAVSAKAQRWSVLLAVVWQVS